MAMRDRTTRKSKPSAALVHEAMMTLTQRRCDVLRAIWHFGTCDLQAIDIDPTTYEAAHELQAEGMLRRVDARLPNLAAFRVTALGSHVAKLFPKRTPFLAKGMIPRRGAR